MHGKSPPSMDCGLTPPLTPFSPGLEPQAQLFVFDMILLALKELLRDDDLSKIALFKNTILHEIR